MMQMRDDALSRSLGPSLTTADLAWLAPLRSSVSCFVIFGCWDEGRPDSLCREVYALLEILGATDATVVDREPVHIAHARRRSKRIRAAHPESMGTRTIDFVVEDMTTACSVLEQDRFDLAYCSGVLYYVMQDAVALQAAIDTMARVVRPGGWVVAQEDPGLECSFTRAGLVLAAGLADAPEHAYCYQEP
jgi:SAM-dependent methyltransferase